MLEHDSDQRCLNRLDTYFLGTGNGAHAIAEVYGCVALRAGYAWIIHDLQRFTSLASPHVAAGEIARRDLNQEIADRMDRRMMRMYGIVAAKDDAPVWLETVLHETGEDIRALAAYTVGTQQLRGPGLEEALVDVHEQSVGTSCRLAIAYAIASFGHEDLLRSYIRGNHLMGFESQKQRLLTMPDNMTKEVMLWDMLGWILALDIATNGKAYQDNVYGVPWARK